MKKDVAYLRVSTDAQVEKYGLDLQREEITEYCEKNDITISRWYVDGGYSGAKLERPAVQELLSDAKRGTINRVYVYKLDRVSRDTKDTLDLLYEILPMYGVKIISMTEEIRTDTPMDKVMITMNAAVNQYEREIIYLRTRAGMVERVKKGYWMGGGRTPYGYRYDRNDGILHIVPEEAENVRQAYHMYLEGYSCDKISDLLGFKGERIVHQILIRKTNLGYIEYKGTLYKGRHEPIIDKKTFEKTQEQMKKRTTNAYITNNHLLSGLCFCGKCGARMRYQKWGNYHKLVCYSHYNSTKEYMKRSRDCDNCVRADAVEREVVSDYGDFLINLNDTKKRESNTDEIEKAIKKANAKIKKFYNLYAENDSQNLFSLIQEEELRLKNLEEELEKEKSRDMKCDKKSIDEIKRISDAWDILSIQEKNKILKECIEKIVINGDEIEIRFITF